MRKRIACITLDLEPDHAGRIPESYEGWRKRYVTELFECLTHYKIPLSVFVVAASLKKNPKIIAYMQRQQVDFHLHSYTHNLRHPDSEEEITNGVKEFYTVFGEHPIGYRAPEGRITHRGYERLHRHGFIFDTSIFPSFWPNPLRIFTIKTPHTGPFNIIELPVTTVSPFRFIFSLSWIQLLGWRWYTFLLNIFPLPDTVIFDFHLHDLHKLPSSAQLSPFWKYIYRHTSKNELQLLHQIFTYLQKKGYSFVSIKSLYTTI